MTAQWPDGSGADDTAIFEVHPNGKCQRLCDRFSIYGEAADADGTHHRWILQWVDRRTGKPREATLPRTLLHKAKNAFALALEDLGIRVDRDELAHNAARNLFSRLVTTRS
jgi:hypothetical protein